MSKSLRRPMLAGLATLILILALPLAAQDLGKVPVRGTPETRSTGQPARIQAQWGPSAGYNFKVEQMSGRLNLGVNAEVLFPQIGFLGITTEGSLGFVGEERDGALSGYVKFPYANPGVEYNLVDRLFYFKFTAIGAPRRGGLFGIGDRLRLDWVPGQQSLQLGWALEQPLGEYRPNRPKDRHVSMEKMRIPAARDLDRALLPAGILAEIETSMIWLDRMFMPGLPAYDPASDRSRRKYDERAAVLGERIARSGRTFAEEDAHYHASLDRAFTHAASGDEALGRSLAAQAERILLDKVLIPTNRLFGRVKKPVNLSAFISDAALEFSVVLGRERLTPAQSATAAEILRVVMMQTDEIAEAQKKRWRDSRMVWLPLHYGLRPDQYDSQAELNDLYARAVGLDFTDTNEIGYLFNDEFYHFYRNLILETEHYQVTIIHDFRNKTGKDVDEIAWNIVADGYLEAFIRAVEAMDQGERDILPEYHLFLDEYYYEGNRSRKIVSFLENLHDPSPVKLGDKALQARVRGQQARLRDAIASSTALGRFGADYVKKNVKVHVNITHQFDPTFKEDAMARDHRKIAFRDIFEENPESGVAVYTGEGIGEYYLGPSWEDRSLLIRGPDLVKLKDETRSLYQSQGYRRQEVPYFLRPRPFPSDYDERCRGLRERGWTASVLSTMNQPGFRLKLASVAKMALYNLMPPGSVILAPDSIWASDFWAAVFVGCALRGQHVYAVAPGQEHAPSAAPPTLALIRESLASMLRGVETLGDEMAAAGGSLHVGIFAADYDVCDPLDRVEAFLAPEPSPHLAAGGFVMCDEILETFARERERLRSLPDSIEHVTDFGEDRKTKLHQKIQFFATREGLEILDRPEWASFLDHYLAHLRQRYRETGRSLDGVQAHWLGAGGSEGEDSDTVVQAFRNDLAARAPEALERVGYFVTVGSQNQDRRGMLLDGEVLVTVAGYESLVTLMDFAFLMRVSHWLDSSAEIDDHFPKEGGFLKMISRWIKNLI